MCSICEGGKLLDPSTTPLVNKNKCIYAERDICNCMQHVFLRLLEKRQGYNLIYLNVIMGIPTNHTAVCCWIFNALFVPGLREGGTLIHWALLWSYRSKSEGTFVFSNPSQTSRGHMTTLASTSIECRMQRRPTAT